MSVEWLSRTELRHYFPDSRIVAERIGPLASLSTTSRSGASHTQTPARYSFDSTKGPSLNTACSPRLSMTVAASVSASPPAKTH
jgi:hypothetical protein